MLSGEAAAGGVNEPDNLEYRSDIMLASLEAGLAFFAGSMRCIHNSLSSRASVPPMGFFKRRSPRRHFVQSADPQVSDLAGQQQQALSDASTLGVL